MPTQRRHRELNEDETSPDSFAYARSPARVLPALQALTQAGTSPFTGFIGAQSLACNFLGPEPLCAGPKPWLSGRAGLGKHYQCGHAWRCALLHVACRMVHRSYRVADNPKLPDSWTFHDREDVKVTTRDADIPRLVVVYP